MFVKLTKDHVGQKAGFVFDTDETIGKSLITAGVAEACATDPLAPLVGKTVEAMLGNLTKTIGETMDATIKKIGDELALSRKHSVPALFGKGGNGDPNRTFGKYLIAVKSGDVKALEEMGSHYVDWEQDAGQKAAMSTQTGTTGGYSVPIEFHEQLMQLAAERSIVRKRATRVPMKGRVCQVPALDHTTAPSAGDTAFLGGVVAAWTEEAAELSETEPRLRQLELTNYELSGYSILSNTLLSDSALGLENFLMKLFSTATAWYEDYAFLRGNGAAKPLGILNWTGLITVNRSAASAFALSDAANMYARLLPGWNTRQTCWVVHPTVIAKLLQMTASGAGSDLIFIDNAHEKPRFVCLGIPIEVTEKVPALNTAGDIMLANFEHYLLGDREQIEIAYSEHVKFLTNQSVWRFVARIGGRPWLNDKITLADATSTLSPFINLAAG